MQLNNKTDSFPLKVLLGQFASADEIRIALRDAGISVSEWGDDLIGCIPLITTTEAVLTLTLVVVEDADLGFTERYTTRALLDRAIERGYGICPPECGPLARLAYHGDKWILIAMDPVADSNRLLFVFGLYRNEDGLCLNAGYASSNIYWFPGKSWLLVRPSV